MTSQTNSRFVKQTADQKLIDGMQKYFTNMPSITVAGQTMSPADMIKVLQDRVATNQAAQAATSSRTDAVRADEAKRTQTAGLVKALRRLVQGMYSQSAETLAAFGLQPDRVSTTTVATKVAAAAKSAATREARHTMGKRQKAKIKGAPPVVDTTPTAPPASPAPPAPRPAP